MSTPVPVPVLCFPPAGAGASFFHPWLGHRDDLRVVPVQLPGRERRLAEEECTDLDTLMARIVPELLAEIDGAERVAVFGHSYGALLAYETVRRLSEKAPDTAATLVVSGSNRPGTPRAGRVTGLPDDDFVAGVAEIAGYKHPALDEPELRELILPTLRTDVAMHENYVHTAAGPLDVPVLAVRGRSDDLVSATELAEWREITSAGFDQTEIDGGHMYLVDGWAALLDLVAAATADGAAS
ncbi:thioesterase II family protein [Streptomyces sp. NBC_01353]|uniref:thioesterase II family protein n=1 Tax=Streptomyces sp. NBC_01353 TaxID=2903835 RepID=UPI002E33AC6F|nr:alpha/beta fold hydrolase [Streptomyces sp. NBC_01353]